MAAGEKKIAEVKKMGVENQRAKKEIKSWRSKNKRRLTNCPQNCDLESVETDWPNVNTVPAQSLRWAVPRAFGNTQRPPALLLEFYSICSDKSRSWRTQYSHLRSYLRALLRRLQGIHRQVRTGYRIWRWATTGVPDSRLTGSLEPENPFLNFTAPS